MANEIPTKEERDANLDSLQEAVDKWYDIEKKRLEDENKFLRKVLEDRGASDAATANLDTASDLVQSELDQFLIGT